jgi:hypothetical protein
MTNSDSQDAVAVVFVTTSMLQGETSATRHNLSRAQQQGLLVAARPNPQVQLRRLSFYPSGSTSCR